MSSVSSNKSIVVTLKEKAVSVHGDSFAYDLVSEGARSLDVVSIGCKIHGLFKQRFANHLSGRGCPKCAQETRNKKALAKWKEKASFIHNGKYSYDFVSKATGIVSILCHDHGIFKQSANAHAHQGNGCPKCSIRKIKEVASISKEEFAERASLVHGGKYSYTGDYIGASNPVTILCKEHGEFRQRAEFHMRGQGCPKCANLNRSSEKKGLWSDPEFKAKMISIFEGNSESRSEITRKLWLDPDFRNKITKSSIDLWSNPDFRERMAVLRKEFKQPVVSSLTKTCQSVLDSLGISYILEHPIGYWNFDLFIPSHNILIECNGEYWHSLPKAIRNDKAKATYIEKYFPNLRLLQIWEVEFFKKGGVRHIITKALGLIDPQKVSFDFSELSVHKIDRKQASLLYSSYHYLGSCRGSEHFGLFIENKLIGACSFGSFQRNEQAKKYPGAVELTRFVLASEYQVKNLGSWFLSRCLKAISKSVVTYADTTHGHDGGLYRACNFKFSHTVPPDYYYIDSGGLVSHKKTVWSQANKMKMSESDYAEKWNLTKKWGGEKSCYIYE